MAESYNIPEVLMCVHLSTRQGQAMRHLPEYARPSTLRISPITVSSGCALEQRSMMVFEGDEEISKGIETLLESDLPILGFNLFNHSFRALSREYPIGPLIPRSIDLFLGLWQLTNGASIKACGTRTTNSGDLKLNTLMFDNFDDYEPQPNNPARCKDIADLWIQTITSHRVNVGGITHKLTKAVGLRLLGYEKFYEQPRSWALSLAMTGSVLGVTSRGHTKYDSKVFGPRYRAFID